MELCKYKSCVLGVCLCDAYGVVSPEAWCVGGESGDPILVLMLWYRWLHIMGLGTLLLGVFVKGELWCGARVQLQQGLTVVGMSWSLRWVFVLGRSN